MGFIERLEQYEAAEALAESRREAELSRKREAEIELHERRREQAKIVQQDSGVNILIRDLRNFLGSFDNNGADQRNSNCDLDSACQVAKWDERKVETCVGYQIPTETKNGWEERMDRYETKFIVIESQPGGNIVFHANGTRTVSEQEWRNSKDTLEIALVQSYKNPGIKSRYGSSTIHINEPVPYYAKARFSSGNY